MPQLELGDKIVLPPVVLLEHQSFKIDTPLLFQIQALDSNDDNEIAQFCSVQEFSASDGQVFIPFWMMQNLKIVEGSYVTITTTLNIPRGIYCRLQPEEMSFLDLAAEIGPKQLMESTLRRYSVLSIDETILVNNVDRNYYLKVVELQPSSVVSLFGDVDLEMDFSAPPQADIRRAHSACKHTPEDLHLSNAGHSRVTSVCSSSTSVLSPEECGKTLGGGAIAENSVYTSVYQSKSSKGVNFHGSNSLHAAQIRTRTPSTSTVSTIPPSCKDATSSVAQTVRLAQASFVGTGYRLGTQHEALGHSVLAPTYPLEASCPDKRLMSHCELCLTDISDANIALHVIHCSKNQRYHKFRCPVCNEKILKSDHEVHFHCEQCSLLVHSNSELENHIESVHNKNHGCPDCGCSFTLRELHEHQRSPCPQSYLICALCGLRVKHLERPEHETACASRTERCENCKKYIKVSALNQHVGSCMPDASNSTIATPSEPTLHPNQLDEPTNNSFECAYCLKRGFLDKRRLERHVSQDCVVARSFRAPIATSATSTKSDVRTLIQGKLKRRQDAKALIANSSSVTFGKSAANHRGNQHDHRVTNQLEPLEHKFVTITTTTKLKSKARPTQPR